MNENVRARGRRERAEFASQQRYRSAAHDRYGEPRPDWMSDPSRLPKRPPPARAGAR